MTLTKYAASLWDRGIATITTDDVLLVLKPLWDRAPETGSRLRGRIEKVMDAAAALEMRTGENPARWKGNLDHLLPPRKKLTRGHHAAMPYSAVPAFMKQLRSNDAASSLALEFLILSATRSNEVRSAVWDEIDLKEMVWTIPKDRMKAGREHRVPIGKRMAEILAQMQAVKVDKHVFPSIKRGLPISDMTLTALIRRLEVKGATVHGFRSSFRDWAGEETTFPRELAEEALAHTVGDLTERAYRRGDALRKRAELMEAWATFLGE
jgi:integrase